MNILLPIIILIIWFVLKYYNSYSKYYKNKLNIIQTWKNNDIPVKYKPLVDKVKYLNPNCNYLFFTDSDIDIFIKSKFPQYYDFFKNLPHVIQKIDFFRYLAIYYYGGVYLDLDINLYKSLDTLSENTKCVFPLEFERNTDKLLQDQGYLGLVGNYAFYAPKKHPFIKKIIDNIVNKRIKIQFGKSGNKYMKYVFYTTGPVMITQSYIDYKSKNQIDIIKKQPFEKSCFGYYGKHVLFGSWKKK